MPERVVIIRLRSILAALGILLGAWAMVGFIFLAQLGLTLIAMSLLLALALNPAVDFFQHRGLNRGLAVGAVYVLAIMVLGLLGLVFIPPLVDQGTRFVQAIPELLADLTEGQGPLGFLERNYHVVERVQVAVADQRITELTGSAAPALSVVKGLATTVVGVVVIAFLTLFMLLEGPDWQRRLTELVPPKISSRVERIGAGIYKAVSGFVTGNLLVSFLSGVVTTVVLLVVGVPYALPLGLFVAIIEVVPYLGPTVATVVVTAVALAQGWVPALIVFLLLLVYHLVEGYTLRPIIVGRALKLSPLAVLIAILLGTEVAGLLGALVAIPIAGSIQVVVTELRTER
ncbi:MAG: AI-2E family transporter [Solirubrobacteraceae bacterium]